MHWSALALIIEWVAFGCLRSQRTQPCGLLSLMCSLRCERGCSCLKPRHTQQNWGLLGRSTNMNSNLWLMNSELACLRARLCCRRFKAGCSLCLQWSFGGSYLIIRRWILRWCRCSSRVFKSACQGTQLNSCTWLSKVSCRWIFWEIKLLSREIFRSKIDLTSSWSRQCCKRSFRIICRPFNTKLACFWLCLQSNRPSSWGTPARRHAELVLIDRINQWCRVWYWI